MCLKQHFGKGQCQKLHLENLTQTDIRRYVLDQLELDPRFVQLMATERQRCEKLSKSIVEKAQGVFLWVYLVTRSIKQGLPDADTISELERRVAQLPSDLESYFQHMLGTIDTFYAQQTARIFYTALLAQAPLTLMTYDMMDRYEENPNFALQLKTRIMTYSEIYGRQERMKIRINVRSKGLLEVSSIKGTLSPLAWTKKTTISRSAEHSKLLGVDEMDEFAEYDTQDAYANSFAEFEVGFLHRTVRDFLSQKGMSEWIMQRLPRGFNYFDALNHANLAQLKSLPFRIDQLYRDGALSSLLECIFNIAREKEEIENVSDVTLLDEVSLVMEQHNSQVTDTLWEMKRTQSSPLLNAVRGSFVSGASSYGLCLYAAQSSQKKWPLQSPFPAYDKYRNSYLTPSAVADSCQKGYNEGSEADLATESSNFNNTWDPNLAAEGENKKKRGRVPEDPLSSDQYEEADTLDAEQDLLFRAWDDRRRYAPKRSRLSTLSSSMEDGSA